jgi:hypothetical protein
LFQNKDFKECPVHNAFTEMTVLAAMTGNFYISFKDPT